jgi:hypothetical protein
VRLKDAERLYTVWLECWQRQQKMKQELAELKHTYGMDKEDDLQVTVD